jgi:hypothetical protein
MNVSVSYHAMQRSMERVQGANLARLWHQARDADTDDFIAFNAYWVPNTQYRVARHLGEDVLLIMKQGTIVTVRVKPQM